MALTELAVAQRKLAIGMQIRSENLHMPRTVHRLERVMAVLGIRGEHVVFVVIPVTGLFPQGAIQDLRRFDFLIAIVDVHFAHVLLDLLPDGPTFGMPEDQTRRFILEVEQVQQATQFAMVALLGLLQHVQIGVLLFLLCPRRAVDTLQHLVLRVAAPVGAGQLHQLEDLQLAGGRHVRATTQIGEMALAVERYVLALRDGLDDLGFVRLTDGLEIGHRLIARQDLALHGLVFFGQFGHFLFDGLQVFRRERTFVGEIVVKTVVDHGTNRHLRIGEQLFDSVGQQVRSGMANHFQTVGILVGDDREIGVMVDQIGRIHQLAIDLAGQCGFRKACAYGRGDVGHGDGLIELPL